ncbi:MAG: Mut7-C RNAse domain-containing protein [Candidatus Micrarchaeota archaeon]
MGYILYKNLTVTPQTPIRVGDALFVADIMLKKLARWLRIMGISVEYPNFTDDDRILALARRKKKTLLTMDRELAARAKKRGVSVYLVPKFKMEKQLARVIRKFNLNVRDFPSRTLCPSCNSKLKEVGKKAVRGKVYPGILARHNIFWLCTNKKCRKVFWEGSHWRKIRKNVKKIINLSVRYPQPRPRSRP